MDISFLLINQRFAQKNLQKKVYNSISNNQNKLLAALRHEKIKRQNLEHQLQQELARQQERAPAPVPVPAPVPAPAPAPAPVPAPAPAPIPVPTHNTLAEVSKKNKFNSLLLNMNEQRKK